MPTCSSSESGTPGSPGTSSVAVAARAQLLEHRDQRGLARTTTAEVTGQPSQALRREVAVCERGEIVDRKGRACFVFHGSLRRLEVLETTSL